jgi:hypothetical protein
LSRETVVSSTSSLQGHRTIKIPFNSSIHKTTTPFLIDRNFDTLCDTTVVNESLNKPVPDIVENSPIKRTHVSTWDVASFLHNKTNLSKHWTLLRAALKVNEEEWAEAVRMSQTQPLLDVIKFILDTWSGRVGLENSIVGNVCDSLSSLGQRNDAG